MKKIVFGFLALTTTLLLTQCKKNKNAEINGNIVTLNWQECAELTDHDMTICFKDAYEYRCPCFADCVWEGAVDATLQVTVNGQETALTLTTNSSPEGLNYSDTLNNKVIKFVKTNITDCNDFGAYSKYQVTVEVTNI